MRPISTAGWEAPFRIPTGEKGKGVLTSRVVIGGLTLAAGAFFLVALLEGGHFSGFGGLAKAGYGGQDEGVYFGAATRLVHGVVPYRDFIFIQPPGISLVLAPFALLGRIINTATGFETARLFIVLVATANVALLGWVTRRRSLVALATGLIVLGFHPDVAAASSTILIEPLLVLGCLCGMALLFDGEQFHPSPERWFAAGVAFGLACTTKLWAALPIIVVIVIARRERHRGALLFLTGAVGSFVVVSLPFFILSPGSFFHDVITTQVGRTAGGAPSSEERLASLLGFNTHAKLGTAVAVVVLAVILWAYVHSRSRRITPLEAFGLVCLVTVLTAFLAAPSFFDHYGAFFAPFLALVAGSAVGRLLTERTIRAAVPLVAALGLLSALFIGHGIYQTVTQPSSAAVAAPIDKLISPGSCVVTDAPSVLLLADRFTSTKADCPQMVDWYGMELAKGGGWGLSVQDASSPAVQATWLGWLREASFVVLTFQDTQRADWGPSLRAFFKAHFPIVHHIGLLWVYQRR